MDPISALRFDSFRLLVTIAIPGATALTPFVLLARQLSVDFGAWLTNQPIASLTVLLIPVLAVGLILEDVGARIETGLIEPKTSAEFPNLHTDWEKYLQLRIGDDLVGQRYLRTIMVRFKFELSMAPALVISSIGLICLALGAALVVTQVTALVVLVFLLTAIYLFVEAARSSGLLAFTRQQILKAPSATVGNSSTAAVK